jgi:nucleoid-associated protein YgaU
MDPLEELKQKYASVLTLIKQQGVVLAHLHLQDGKLFLQGAAPSEDIKNNLWNEIKKVNPSLNDISADISVDSSLPKPAAGGGSAQKTYTVQSGDSLSKIAKQFYGSANDYMRIFDANKDKLDNPDTVKAGQELVIPA